VGRTLCDILIQAGYEVRMALRNRGNTVPQPGRSEVLVGDISGETAWDRALQNVQLVVHAAGRAHVLKDTAENAHLYERVNAEATRALCAASVRAGVKRFVYLSSIKVNGEQTGERPFTSEDVPNPQDPYALSKLHAENSVREAAAGTQMEVAIVRPPLVYGPGVRANFLRLLQLIERGYPLPFGSIDNRRSLVGVWNLCDLVMHLLSCPLASGKVWLIADDESLATRELLVRIAHAMDLKLRLVPVPAAVLRIAGGLLGKRAEVDRMCGSLLVDAGPTRRELNWTAPLSVDEGLARTVRWYRASGGTRGT